MLKYEILEKYFAPLSYKFFFLTFDYDKHTPAVQSKLLRKYGAVIQKESYRFFTLLSKRIKTTVMTKL